MASHPGDIVGFWRNAGPRQWFAKNAAFDDAIRLKFEPVHLAASRGKYDGWLASAEGALALIILFDQFPRNLWRGSAHAFATDPLARRTASAAIALGHDLQIEGQLRPFAYLPFEHSESLADQDRSVALCERLEADTGDSGTLKWARKHREIIVRFGRFPHRNAALGRETTDEEQAFLDEGGFSG
jgi:uncharacterized protein (DUF924 family)